MTDRVKVTITVVDGATERRQESRFEGRRCARCGHVGPAKLAVKYDLPMEIGTVVTCSKCRASLCRPCLLRHTCAGKETR
jgi:hypothetical protein